MRQPKVFLVACVVSLLLSLGSPGAEGSRFTSKKYGFSMETPPGWHLAVLAERDLPLYLSAPLTRLQNMGIEPKRGVAMVHVVSQSDLSGRNRGFTLDDWADFDQLGTIRNTCSTQDFRMPASTAVSRAVIMRCDEKRDRPSQEQQRDVNVYWELHGNRFATYMNSVVGDQKAMAYERTLAWLMRSLQPLGVAR